MPSCAACQSKGLNRPKGVFMKIAKVIMIAATSLLLGTSMLAVNAQKTTSIKTPTMIAKTSKMAAKITPVNINTANLKTLETLPGIGPKIAAEIIKNRPYKNAKELETKVKGIGKKVWNEIKEYVLFK
jgi:competence protein ComEA